jgi:hypothetical protein
MQDERKKLLILGLLAIVMVAVGAFQFKPGPAPVVTKSSSPAPSPVAVQGQVASPVSAEPLPVLAERDPFAVPQIADRPEEKHTVALSAGADQTAFNGAIPPMPISGKEMMASPVPSSTNAVPKPVPTFDWMVTGVVVGGHPIGIFVDRTGNQRLIVVGSMIDPNSRLVSVTRNSATVNFRGRMLRLSVGGYPNAN